ncbi:MAG: CRISPR-associated helicase Cas3' [Gemmataceae bacterium]|nr:CRISPR-associated helicase Cas3' [Gemmataceae bacterium]
MVTHGIDTQSLLWAKSGDPSVSWSRSMTLAGHLEDVYQAAGRLLDAIADTQLSALGLDKSYSERLYRCVRLAAAVHDLGKANDHFQAMILGRRDVQQHPQGLRHEWVTVLILQQLRQWLLPAVGGCEIDFAIVEWAVAGHHPGYDRESPPRSCPDGAGTELTVLTGHPHFAVILNWLRDTFQLSPNTPVLSSIRYELTGTDSVFDQLKRWARQARLLWEQMTNPYEQRLVAAIKCSLIAADVAGSALPRLTAGFTDRWAWIGRSLAATPQPGEIQTVVEERARTFTDRQADREQFQHEVATSTAPVTLVKAGCGSGKTQAAYMWAARNHPTRRLYFCYPTTGTATEGFRDYLFEADVRADLFHSRRDVDFEIILNTGADTIDTSKDGSCRESEESIRIESLDAWSTPLVACTVDTVLGLIQNHKRGLFAWPALVQSAFIFDEIHAYDDALFGALLRFLKDVPGVPVLLMTASLPAAREEALRDTLRRFRNLELRIISGPEQWETLPRYHREQLDGVDPLPLVQVTLERNGKVLWVCNTVDRVMQTAKRLHELRPLIYHSRFKYVDRVARHQGVITAFRQAGPALAICTQVAEMSLDLSADLLITELAPVPAMIQRLGRLNRRARPGSPTRPWVVLEPENVHPYTQQELDLARSWLAKLPSHNISQRHLAQNWEQTADKMTAVAESCWLDGGPTTNVKELRQPSWGITVLMEQDVPLVRDQPRQRGRYLLPMSQPPKYLKWQKWPREGGIPVAPSGTIEYNPEYGAQWINQE